MPDDGCEYRYFIVIDDIWEKDTWGKIKCVLVDNNRGNAVITTTRNIDVGAEIGPVYRPSGLSRDDSRKLFYKKVFDIEACPDNKSTEEYNKIVEVSEQILEKCEGVPLAITTAASVLVNKSPLEWSDAYRSIGFGHDDTHVEKTMKILSFSYYDLPLHLRACLLYLSVFPEDYTIDKNMLIWAWIAEGFVHDEEGKGLFEVGNIYFNELINRSLIMPVEGLSGLGFLISCRVHDMVLQFIRSLSRKQKFVDVLDNVREASADSRRISLQPIQINTSECSSSPLEETVDDMLPHVRSFTVIRCANNDVLPPLSSFSVLRVLAIEGCGKGFPQGHLHLKGLVGLLHLRCLRLSFTPNLCELPEDIGNLKCLEVLDISSTDIEALPKGVSLLRKLLCLRASWKTRVPTWVGELTSLQELRIWPSADEYACFAKELRKLTELRILVSWNAAPDAGTERTMLESLGIQFLPKLKVIAFQPAIGSRLHKTFDASPRKSAIEICDTEGLVLTPHLLCLILYGFEFSRLPPWINSFRLPYLCELVVEVRDMEQEDMEFLGGLPELRTLSVIPRVDLKRYRVLTCPGGAGAFRNLRFLSVLNRSLKFLPGSLPRLQSLELQIDFIYAGFDLEFGLENIPSLQEVSVSITCDDPKGREEVLQALRRASDIHHNHLMLRIRKIDQRRDKLWDIVSGIYLFFCKERMTRESYPVNHLYTVETRALMEQLNDAIGDHIIESIRDELRSQETMIPTYDSETGHEVVLSAARARVKERLSLIIQGAAPLLKKYKETVMNLEAKLEERSQIAGQMTTQWERAAAIRKEKEDIRKVEGALPVDDPRLLVTKPLMAQLEIDVRSPGTRKYINDEADRLLNGISPSYLQLHELLENIEGCRRLLERVTLVNEQSAALLDKINAALDIHPNNKGMGEASQEEQIPLPI